LHFSLFSVVRRFNQLFRSPVPDPVFHHYLGFPSFCSSRPWVFPLLPQFHTTASLSSLHRADFLRSLAPHYFMRSHELLDLRLLFFFFFRCEFRSGPPFRPRSLVLIAFGSRAVPLKPFVFCRIIYFKPPPFFPSTYGPLPLFFLATAINGIFQ